MSLDDVTTYSVDVNGLFCHAQTASKTPTNHSPGKTQQAPAGKNSKNQGSIEDSSPLINKHIKDYCIKRDLDRRWVEASCSSLTATEATKILYYTAKSPGILIEGANGQYQFKPDKPWAEGQGKKAPKYRTALGDEYDALLPKHPSDQNYWTNISQLKERCYKINGHPPSVTSSRG